MRLTALGEAWCCIWGRKGTLEELASLGSCLVTASAVASAGRRLVHLQQRRHDASHSRSVRSAEAESRRWCSPLPAAGDGANATAVTLYQMMHLSLRLSGRGNELYSFAKHNF